MPEEQTELTPESPFAALATAGKLPARKPFLRWLVALAWLVFVLVTLLAFPGHLAIVAAAIAIVIFTCLALQQIRQAAMVSLVAGIILIAKTPSIQIDFIFMVAAFLVSGVAYFWVTSKLRWVGLCDHCGGGSFFWR